MDSIRKDIKTILWSTSVLHFVQNVEGVPKLEGRNKTETSWNFREEGIGN